MNEQRHYTVVRLQAHEFQQWLMSGVRRLTTENCWTCVRDSAQPATVDTGDWIYVALPLKYVAPINTDHGVYALIDDVHQISCADDEQTGELRARLHTLGETWLPIMFSPELVASREQMPVSILPDDTSVDAELDLVSSGKTEQMEQIAFEHLTEESKTTKTSEKKTRQQKSSKGESPAKLPQKKPNKKTDSQTELPIESPTEQKSNEHEQDKADQPTTQPQTKPARNRISQAEASTPKPESSVEPTTKPKRRDRKKDAGVSDITTAGNISERPEKQNS
jgi:hypothetical protein